MSQRQLRSSSQEMRAFNQQISTNGIANRNNSSSTANIPRSFLTCVLELSQADNQWKSRFCEDERSSADTDDLNAVGRNTHCVTRGLSIVLNILRLLCFYPRCSAERKKRFRNRWRSVLLVNVALLVILLNTYLCKHTIGMVILFKSKFGFLHASTVSSIVTGIKPFINVVVICLFVIRVHTHQRLLDSMDTTELCFRSAFSRSPPLRYYSFVFAFIILFAFMIPFTLRVFEFYCTEETLFTNWMTDVSFVLVPLLTVWNVAPLIYYELCNRIVRSWCRLLTRSLRREHRQRHYTLKFYYELFLRITSVQEAIGHFFNPYVMFSLAWSLVILSLTIYFITEPTSSLVEPLSAFEFRSEAIRERLNRKVRFTLAWASLQVIAAIVYIFTICSTGMQTNEETRQILSAVLTIIPNEDADLDRFQISCFVHKMSTQYMWGMTVWRAFPLERTTFFTLVSVIITYSFLLLKLKDNPAVSPIRRNLLTNSTY